MELFKLFGKIAVDGTEAISNIDSVVKKADTAHVALSQKLTGIGDKMTSWGTKFLPVTAAVGGIGIASVKAAADVKAANSQFEQTFGELQSTATKAIGKVSSESGILQTRLNTVGTSIYAFAKSSGADSAEAMALMETALQATADSAAYYDRSLEDTAESLQSFLKGNFANDAALGVSATETTRNAAAMELFGQKYNDLSEIQKQQTLLKMVTDSQKLSGAMGQAARESDGFENVTGNLKESIRLLGTEIGEVILPTVINLGQKATTMIQKFSDMDDGTKKLILTIGGIVAAVGPVLIVGGSMAKGISSIITLFGSLHGVGTTVIGLIGKAPAVISGVIGVGSKLLSGIGALGSFIGTTLIPAIASIGAPVLIVIGVITALIAIGVALYKNWDDISAWCAQAWDKIKETVSAGADAVMGFFSGIINFVKDNWQGLLLLLVNPFVGAFKLLYDNCEGFRTFINNFFLGLKDAISSAGEWIVNGVTGFVSNVSEKWDNLKSKASETWSDMKENASQKWSEMKENVSEKASELATKAIDKLKELKENNDKINEAIRQKASDAWEKIKNDASQKASSLKDNVTAAFDTIGNKASSIWDGIKSKTDSVFSHVRDFIGGVVDKIKNAFHFEWKMPDIKLPHFDIQPDGWEIGDLLKGSIPHLDVEWYAKGGVMDGPTAFGINPATGKTMVGGEAGKEAIAPIETLKQYIAEAVAGQNAGAETALSELLSLLRQYLPMLSQLAQLKVVMDTGETVGALSAPMSEALYELITKGKRGV